MARFDFQTGNSSPAFGVVQEWQRQFEVRDVEADQPISEEIDVLVAAVPSGFARGSARLSTMIGFGRASQRCFCRCDAADKSVFGAKYPTAAGINPFMQQQPPEPKVNPTPLLQALAFSTKPAKLFGPNRKRVINLAIYRRFTSGPMLMTRRLNRT